MRGFFDEAIDEFEATNDAQPFARSEFLQEFDREVQALMQNCVGQIWTMHLANTIMYQVKFFLMEYARRTPGFDYSMDSAPFFKDRKIIVEYREGFMFPFQTALIQMK